MKKLFITPLLLFMSLFALAQVQKGTVRLQNSGKKPVSGVKILYTGAKATESDAAGSFRLVFAGKKPGDIVFMEKIHKQGFELVNFKELEINKISNQDAFGVDIILAPAGTLEAARREYYRISNTAMMAGLDREKSTLKAQLEQAKITQKQYLQKYEELKNQYEEQRKNLDILAEKFARTNFDDMGAVQREALELFKAGKIDEALKKLQGADLIGQAKKVIEEEKRLNILQQDINEQKARAQKQKIETIGAIYLEADIYLLRYEILKAEKLYDQLLILDSTNLEVLQKVADFYCANGRFVKALRLYSQIVTSPQANDLQKADAYQSMGELYTQTSNHKQALEAYNQSYNLYLKMIGLDFGKIKKSELNQPGTEAYNELMGKMNQNEDGNILIKQKIVVICGIIGEIYLALGNTQEGFNYIDNHIVLGYSVSNLDTTNVDFKQEMAMGNYRLAELFVANGDPRGQAMMFYKSYNQMEKDLFKAYPNNLNLKKSLADSYDKLGNFQLSSDSVEQAIISYQEYNRLTKEIFDTSPQNLKLKSDWAKSQGSLGDGNFTIGDFNKALKYYQEYNRLAKEISTTDGNDSQFKSNLADSYLRLGHFFEYQKDKVKTKTNYEEAKKLYQALKNVFPDSKAYSDNLAYVEEKLLGL
jgi:tetratricopeptide (TPR) repeat protein